MSLVVVARENRVLHLTLNRPEKRNALNIEMCRELVDATEAIQDDPDIGSVLIDAEGRVFCAGTDFQEALDRPRECIEVHERLFSIGRRTQKPIVVCVNGPAMGGGVGLIAQSHVAVAAQGSLFGLVEIRGGMWPFLLFRSIEAALGVRRALELSLTGRLFSSQDALTYGLIHQVAHTFEVEDRAAAIARDIARASPDVVRLGLQYVHDSRDVAWEQAGDLAARLREECAAGPDFREGVDAFLERREAQWPSMPEGTYRHPPRRKPEGDKTVV